MAVRRRQASQCCAAGRGSDELYRATREEHPHVDYVSRYFNFSTRQAQITFETSCAACPGVIVALSALRR